MCCIIGFDVNDLSENAHDDIEGLEASATHVASLLANEPADSEFSFLIDNNAISSQFCIVRLLVAKTLRCYNYLVMQIAPFSDGYLRASSVINYHASSRSGHYCDLSTAIVPFPTPDFLRIHLMNLCFAHFYGIWCSSMLTLFHNLKQKEGLLGLQFH